MIDPALKTLLLEGETAFWGRLAGATREAADFEELFSLSALRRKAHARQLPRPGGLPEKLRIALLGGYNLYPFRELLEHLCEIEGHPCELWAGEFDNYISEVFDGTGGLHSFAPQVAVLLPAESRCAYSGKLNDPRETQQAEAGKVVEGLLNLARVLHEKTRAEVIMTNFRLPARDDLGAYRSRTLGSSWNFRKRVNIDLGLGAPPYLHICDLEFLSHRLGGIESQDARGWFESKQPCSPQLLVELAREVVHLIGSRHRAPKKVLALDLDNTLWGGVVADDGIEKIEVGDTSPRGEAFKAFQKYLRSLKERGVLLAVCSKNDRERAHEVFLNHPEMILRLDDFVSFQANWEAKSENLRRIAAELNVGLDSVVFVDDNPAEIEIVRQFAPDVATILLGADPSDYVAQLEDSRLFEPHNISTEDTERTAAYQSESKRKVLLATVTDMDAYLTSLQMEAAIFEFRPVDVQRLAQLINKSNQFNLTTRRRTEADIHALMADPGYVNFSVRLKDRFGDYGLVSIVIARKAADILEIDTWLMSCRVLKRQLEEAVLNELARLAKHRGCSRLRGIYLPTSKNEMVRDFYLHMGFTKISESANAREFELRLEKFEPRSTRIQLPCLAYGSI